MKLRIKRSIGKPEYRTLLEKSDATHLVSEVTIGSSLDVIVQYEHSRQEDKVEIESVLFEALQFGSTKLNAADIQFSEKGDNLRTESLRISLKGSMKKKVFLSNVS